jgi:hypothetical protein
VNLFCELGASISEGFILAEIDKVVPAKAE